MNIVFKMHWKKTRRAPNEKWESECGNFFIVHKTESQIYTVVSELRKLKPATGVQDDDQAETNQGDER